MWDFPLFKLSSLAPHLLPSDCGFAVKRNEGAFLPAVPWRSAAVVLLQAVDHDTGHGRAVPESVSQRQRCETFPGGAGCEIT